MSSAVIAPRHSVVGPNGFSQDATEFTGDLHVERTDIKFENQRPGLVDIRILVRNCGVERSAPTFAELSAAAFGAFVPWRPLATVAVPSLAPNESFVVRTTARQRRPKPLGPPDRVPPRSLLVALGAEDDDRPSRRLNPTARGNFRSVLESIREGRFGTANDNLPDDPFSLLTRGSPHWAGNLNIFIGGRSVERHLAQSLRVYPGRPNMAIFFVGTRRDAYAFDLKGDAAEWNAALYDLTRSHSLLPGRSDGTMPLNQWIDLMGRSLVILRLHPPESCTQGTVEVHVTKRSTSETAIVEFALDANAAGPGCYYV